jgi:hypothetical protein
MTKPARKFPADPLPVSEKSRWPIQKNFRTSPEEVAAMAAYCRRKGITSSTLVRLAIRKYIGFESGD